MKKIVTKARETKHIKGRANDDKRSFVECLIMAICDDVPEHGTHNK